MELIVSCSLAVIGYSYFGYPMLAYCMSRLKRRMKFSYTTSYTPSVTIIIAAYNERECIVDKINNTFSLDYPKEQLQIIIVTDGSTDGTNDIVSNYPSITLLHKPSREGKSAALNRAIALGDSEIIVFSDANAMLNKEALRELNKHFQDTVIGGVAGEKRILSEDRNGAVIVEGFYWRYESSVRQWDSDWYAVTGAVGELYAIRRSLIDPIPADIVCDDLYLTMRMISRGARMCYEANAYSAERTSESIGEEWKRKVRIAAGSLQALGKLNFLRWCWTQPLPAFQFMSRKILRWIIVPYLLVALLVLGMIYVGNGENEFFRLLFLLQFIFYSVAFFGWILKRNKQLPSIFFFPFYIVFANAAMIVGTYYYLIGKSFVKWVKVRR